MLGALKGRRGARGISDISVTADHISGHKNCVHHLMAKHTHIDESQHQPNGMSWFLDAVARFPNRDKMLVEMVTPAVQEQANKVEKQMGLLAALELIHTLGPAQVISEKIRAGSDRSVATRRKRRVINPDAVNELVIDLAMKQRRATLWANAWRDGTNLSRKALAARYFPQVAAKTAAKYVMEGLIANGELHLWTDGAPGPKKHLPSNR